MSAVSTVNRASATPKTIPARTRTPVISVETLWTGGIIEIKVPENARCGVYDAGEDDIPFLHFARPAVGGLINFFVHTDDNSCAGSKIRACVSVMRKTLEGGRVFLHIDLKPVRPSTEITHLLCVVRMESRFLKIPGWLVFETPRPMCAAIILAPPGAKIG